MTAENAAVVTQEIIKRTKVEDADETLEAYTIVEECCIELHDLYNRCLSSSKESIKSNCHEYLCDYSHIQASVSMIARSLDVACEALRRFQESV